MSSAPNVETSVLIEGLRAAYARYIASEVDAPAAFHATFEMLAWAGVIFERFPEGGVPSVLNGLRYARNLVLHLGIDMLDLLIIVGTYDSAMYDVVTYNGRQAESTWRYREDLPKPRNPKRLPKAPKTTTVMLLGGLSQMSSTI